MKHQPKVIVVVLTWNSKEVSIRCIESVLGCGYPNLSLVVVDNDSTDGLVDLLKDRYSDQTLILNDRNLGYVGGNNRGIREAVKMSGDYIFLLNNDIILRKGAIETLVARAEERPEFGLLGPAIHNAQTGRLDNLGWRFNRRKGEMLKNRETSASNDLLSVDVVPGCSLFIRASAIAEVGYFDERLFALSDDVDYSLRFKQAGYGVGIVPDAVVLHENALSLKKDTPARIYYHFRNRMLLMRKHGSLRDWLTFFPYFIKNDFGNLLREVIGKIRRHESRSGLRNLRASLSGMLHFVLGRWGKGPAWIHR